jgi:hypothetical protein
MSISGIKKFFDLSIRDQVEASILNGGSDNMFLFSGPPQFATLGSVGAAAEAVDGVVASNGSNLDCLCPLLFTNSFNEPDPRPGRMSLNTLGGKKTISAPNTGNPNLRNLVIGAMSLVTGRPGFSISGLLDQASTSQEQWNLLKRAYWWAINSPQTDITDLFKEGNGFIGDQSEHPEAVAPDEFSCWGNFGRSSFYDMPFGILALGVNKGGVAIKAKYYEGVQILAAGAELSAQINGPISVSSTNGLTLSFSNVKTFTQANAGEILGGDDTAEKRLLMAINTAIST